ncbi:MAG: hypothetical protein ACIALR_08295 [Blastopirellula sp. JB062]
MSEISLATALGLFAYVGPGLGAGTVAVVIGFLGSILLALFVTVWYPVKRMLKLLRGDNGAKTQQKDLNEPATDSAVPAAESGES